LHIASEINADLDDATRDGRCYVRLLVRSEAAGGFKKARQLTRDGGRGRHVNGGGRGVGVLCVLIRLRF
jgi:hypothetical protein